MELTLTGRVPIAALDDVEKFLQSAQHLKALTLQLHQRRCRESRLQASLAQQIVTFTQHCGTLAHLSPRLADLWKQTQDELRALTADRPAAAVAPAGPPPPVAPSPTAGPAPPAGPPSGASGAGSPGGRANSTSAKPAA